MATPSERAQVVWWYAESKSVIQVQRNFRRVYRKEPPTFKTIKEWCRKFLATGSVSKAHGGGNQRIQEEDIENVRRSFVRSPRKSIRQAARELGMTRSTVHKVLRRRLQFHAYKLQILQEIKPDDRPKRESFGIDMLNRIDDDEHFLSHVLFSDEATFNLSGKVNRHNVRIWGSQNPHVIQEHVRGSPKIHVWCGLLHNDIIGPFFFIENTVTGNSYLDMLVNFAVPQVEHLQPTIIFQQDGAPPHWSRNVRDYLNETFPNRWIGRDGPIPWPPRSPDITPLDFFFWGYVKDQVYSTRVDSIEHLKERIRNAIRSVTVDMLHSTWREIEFRLDILRATRGAHVEVQ